MELAPVAVPVSTPDPGAAVRPAVVIPARAGRAGGRLPALDALRLLAALSVMSFHYLGTQNNAYIWGENPHQFAPKVHDASLYGFLGVEFFFLISGFVICMSSWGRTLKQFAVSRISRLFPAYWCAIVLSAVVIAAVPIIGWNANDHIDFRLVLANLTMAPGPLHAEQFDGVVWTLWVEARFYLLMAGMIAIGMNYRRMVAFCGLWLMAALVVMDTRATLLDEFVLSQYTGVFVAGIAVYLMRRYGQNLLLWGLLGFAWCVELAALYSRMAGRIYDNGVSLSWGAGAALITGGLCLLLLVAIGPLSRIRWRWLTTAGMLTYPFYLVHQSLGIPMIVELRHHFPELRRVGVLGVVVVSMLLAAWLIHRLVERPGGRWLKNGLAKSLTPRAD
jgi:peptidoglycan/LPS O-acetylase OafA/YrhL